MQEYNDEEVLVMLRGSSQQRDAALNFLYDNMYPSIAGFIIKNSGNATDAKDLFQESLIVFYEKAITADFELTGSIKNYLHAVCRNIWFKKLRKRGKEISTDDVAFYAEPEMIETDTSSSERGQLFAKLMNQIGESCRNILLLFYYERQSMKEIAVTLNLANEGVAKNKKARCMQKLKELAKQ